MGLTDQSTGLGALKSDLLLQDLVPGELVVALAGNPNTGKSTVFNNLTGLRQHTGNWPGKTVVSAKGRYSHRSKNHLLVDLPGTYSLLANSVEEEVARDFILFARPAVTVVVADATCLERNLNLVLQVLEITPHVVVCVNLVDEARRKKIKLNLFALSKILGVPVVGTNARDGHGMYELKEAICRVAAGLVTPEPYRVKYGPELAEAAGKIASIFSGDVTEKISSRWLAMRLLEGDTGIIESLRRYLKWDLNEKKELYEAVASERKKLGPGIQEDVVTAVVRQAEEIASRVVQFENLLHNRLDRKIDNLVTSRRWGIPIMLALLGLVFWITITGANYPSEILAEAFLCLEEQLTALFIAARLPEWLYGLLVLGGFRTLSWVVSVMLPPMAIFFPLFTLLEDLGYLPRVAFNLDNLFKKAKTHGKQALTMCMGFGCNAAGVISCRIIDSPRERLIAVITNNFVPCNGRFPILIALSTIFIGKAAGALESVAAAGAVLGGVVLGFLLTLMVSRILSGTVLKGLPSSFTLELPPYRKPLVGRILLRSLLDRTFFVLGRAVMVATPAGLVIWFMANTMLDGVSILEHGAALLDPFARAIGLDGFILMAFILGLPANEIVIPILIMSYMATGSMMELESLEDLRQLFIAHGWTWLTAVCTMLFTLNHFPCGTTLLTIRKETQSLKWTLYSFLVPTVTGIVICFVVAQSARLLGLV
jgi:ferrous iron transport protein B